MRRAWGSDACIIGAWPTYPAPSKAIAFPALKIHFIERNPLAARSVTADAGDFCGTSCGVEGVHGPRQIKRPPPSGENGEGISGRSCRAVVMQHPAGT